MSVWSVLAHLVVVVVAASSTWAAYRWVVETDTNCTLPAGPNRIAAITFAGTADRAEQAAMLCAGLPLDEQVQRDRSVLLIDAVLAASYSVLLVAASRLGTGLVRHDVTRATGVRCIWGAVAVGLTDVMENAALWHAVGQPDDMPRWVGAVTTVAVARLSVVCLVGCFAAAGAAAGVAVVFRALLGPAVRPQFDRRLRSVAHPHPSVRGRLDGKVARRTHARFLGPDGKTRPSGPHTLGVCFSGGGIRAASFALGALQVLQERGALRRMRYLATVSGGGYTGMAWQIASRAAADDPPPDGLPSGGEPLSARSAEAAFLRDHSRYLWPPVSPGKRWSSTLTFLAVASTALRGILFNVGILLTLLFVVTRPLGWLTRSWAFADAVGGRLVRPGHWWHLGALVLQAGAIVAVAWPVAWRWWNKMGSTRARRLAAGVSTTAVAGVSAWFVLLLDRPRTLGVTWAVGWWLVALGAVITVVWAWRVKGRSAGPGFGIAIIVLGVGKLWMDAGFRVGPEGRVTLHAVDAVVRVVLLLVALLVLLAVLRVMVSLPRDRERIVPVLVFLVIASVAFSLVAGAIVLERSSGAAAMVALVAAGAVVVAVRVIKRLPSPPKDFVGGPVNAARTIISLMTALSATSGLAMAMWHWDVPTVGLTVTDLQRWAFLAALLVVVYAFVDQRWWSPHNFYKRRLSASFSPVRDADGKASALPFRIRTSLVTWGRRVSDGPEVLICAAVYDTERIHPRDVQALPFVFSAEYVGSADLGYARTYDVEAVLGARNQGYATVQAAAAISGAAVSPALGAVRVPVPNQVLAFFNLRQGVWLPSPASVNQLLDNQDSDRPDSTQRWVRTRRLGYLLKEFASRYDTEDRFLYVNDGGQFDNLGLYELFSRRCRLVYAFDASGDRPGSVNTLLGTMRLAHERLGMDFGPPAADQPLTVAEGGDVKRAWRERLFSDLVTKVEDPKPDWADARATRSAVAVFSAWYPAQPGSAARERATVVVAKARLAKDRLGGPPPAEVLTYAGLDAKFPANSTGDQFIDDIQFDAYVALGRWVADDALARQPIPEPNPAAAAVAHD